MAKAVAGGAGQRRRSGAGDAVLLNDTSLRHGMAENARESVSRFSSDRMARNYLDFYQRMGHLPVTAAVTA